MSGTAPSHSAEAFHTRTRSTYLSGAAVRLGENLRHADTLRGLDAFFAEQALPPDPTMLGMDGFHVAESDEWVLAVEAARPACECAGDIDAFILCSSRFRGETADHADGLRKVLTRLGLKPTFTAGVTLSRCASFLSGLSLADALVASGRSTTCLVVTADRFVADSERLRPFALFSDGAAACLVSAAPIGAVSCYRIAGFGVASDVGSLSETARVSPAMMRAADHALSAASGLGAASHDAVLPTNVYLPIAMMAEAQAGATMASIYQRNIPRRGHVFAADPLVNLLDFEAETDVTPGTRLLLGATVPGYRVSLSLERL